VNRIDATICSAILASAVLFCACGDPPADRRRRLPQDDSCRGLIAASFNRFIAESGEPFERFEFTALFPRHRERDLESVNALLPVRIPESDLPIDTCSKPEPAVITRAGRPSSMKDMVTLVDAGDMFVSFGEGPVPIPTRTFPDLLKVINGVIYTANPDSRLELIPGRTYTLKTTGTDLIGPFEVVLDAPDDLGDIRLNGQSPADGIPSPARDNPLQLTWEGSGYGDEILLETAWNALGLSWNFTCRMKDDGAFDIPADMSMLLNDTRGETPHEMSLTRIRQVSFAARGLSFGSFTFVARTAFLVEFE